MPKKDKDRYVFEGDIPSRSDMLVAIDTLRQKGICTYRVYHQNGQPDSVEAIFFERVDCDDFAQRYRGGMEEVYVSRTRKPNRRTPRRGR